MENVKYQRKEGVQLFINEELELEVRAIKNEDRSISLNAEDTAIGFGWYQIKNNKKYPKWERVNGFISEFGNSPLVGKDDYIPESLFYLLGMKANNDVAKILAPTTGNNLRFIVYFLPFYPFTDPAVIP